MKAAYLENPGAPEAILFGDLPTPKPAEGEVLVKVAAVAVNPIDTYIRSGMIPVELPKPFVIGCDLAGSVEEVGPRVSRLKPGDRVWGSNQGLMGRQGTFAQYAAVAERWLYPIPDDVSERDAAAIALVGITAHLGLFREGWLQANETVFVHGGSGGVGSCVVQMAKAVEARVLATAGSDEKAELCRSLGADRVVNYKNHDLDAAIRDFAPSGLDLWWETLREPDLPWIVDHMGRRSRIIIMAGRDARATLPIGPFYTRDCSIHGFAMFNATPEEQRAAAEDINRWMSEGKLRPVIGRVMKLSEAAAAHRLQEDNTLRGAGTLTGKIVLEPDA